MVEVGLSSWDVAAPIVLVEEAGGRVTDFDGRRAIDAGTFVATNGLLHDEVLARLRGERRTPAPVAPSARVRGSRTRLPPAPHRRGRRRR